MKTEGAGKRKAGSTESTAVPKKLSEYIQVSLRLDPKTHETLRGLSFHKKISLQKLALTAITTYISQLELDPDDWKKLPALSLEDRESVVLFANILSRSQDLREKLSLKLLHVTVAEHLVQRHGAINPKKQDVESSAYEEAIRAGNGDAAQLARHFYLSSGSGGKSRPGRPAAASAVPATEPEPRRRSPNA